MFIYVQEILEHKIIVSFDIYSLECVVLKPELKEQIIRDILEFTNSHQVFCYLNGLDIMDAIVVP